MKLEKDWMWLKLEFGQTLSTQQTSQVKLIIKLKFIKARSFQLNFSYQKLFPNWLSGSSILNSSKIDMQKEQANVYMGILRGCLVTNKNAKN